MRKLTHPSHEHCGFIFTADKKVRAGSTNITDESNNSMPFRSQSTYRERNEAQRIKGNLPKATG